jgi:hypothetical protein
MKRKCKECILKEWIVKWKGFCFKQPVEKNRNCPQTAPAANLLEALQDLGPSSRVRFLSVKGPLLSVKASPRVNSRRRPLSAMLPAKPSSTRAGGPPHGGCSPRGQNGSRWRKFYKTKKDMDRAPWAHRPATVPSAAATITIGHRRHLHPRPPPPSPDPTIHYLPTTAGGGVEERRDWWAAPERIRVGAGVRVRGRGWSAGL